MIRLINLLIIVFILSQSGISQERDLFDQENSQKFASYLYESGQFELASEEFERVVFMNPNDSLSILRLLKAYRNQKKYGIGVRRAFELLPESSGLDNELFDEIFRLSLLAGDFEKGTQLLSDHNKLNEDDRLNYELSILLLQKEIEGANEIIENAGQQSNPFYNQLRKMAKAHDEIKYKNPYVAGGMSAIVPGMGKIYSGDWQDGLIALLFVGSNAWQAYRGFSKDGIKSNYGWVFGSITAGFWLGNIYGSYKSARKFNKKQKIRYYESVERTVFSGI
jgi:tetratricopeptide (TPR) repeat protein